MEERRFTDAPLQVSATLLQAGSSAILQADGAWEGNAVVFVASVTGLGVTETPYGFDLGITGRIFRLGWDTADAMGQASVTTFSLPPTSSGLPVWLQIVERKGDATFELSPIANYVIQ